MMETGTLVDRVYETLKLKILRQEFSHGQKLNLTSLAKELNVSNTPLREAVSRLEKVGLIKIVPYRGPYVRRLSLAEVAEAYDVRIVLEELSVRLVATNVTPDTLTELDRIHQEYERAFDKGREHVIEIDLLFHETLARQSGNRTLIDFLQMLADWTKLFIQFMPPPRPPTNRIGEHHFIIEALKAGDQDQASQAMRQHLIFGKRSLLQHLAGQLQDSEVTEQLPAYPDIWEPDPLST